MKYSLPKSADDLLIKDGKLLMRSLSVYEVLRRFGHIIRLTPFRFEDFSAALLYEDQSHLIAEIHIQLLRTLIREDRQQQTWLGPPDLRDCINLYLNLVDHTNWPSVMKLYLSADTRENSKFLDDISREDLKNYPFRATLEFKIFVLEHLCDQFLSSNLARDEILSNSGFNDKRDTACRLCSKTNGDLIECGSCPAIYHLKCTDPPLDEYPNTEGGDEAYLCVICRSNHTPGVSDCFDTNDPGFNLKRHEALGIDKLGRRFWFLIRRVFVVDEVEDDVRYFSTKDQLSEIRACLDENRQDKYLIDNLLEQQSEIERQMQVTQDLYQSLMKDYKQADGTFSKLLGQDGTHTKYVNHYSTNNLASGKAQNTERDINRSLGNKFCMSSMNSFRWLGAIDGNLTLITSSIKTTLLKMESLIPKTFIHPCWQSQRPSWLKLINYGKGPEDYAIALSLIESSIKPVLFKSAWHETVGFVQIFRSTFAEREELKKTDRQPRGFERREWFNQDFETSFRLGTMVKFSSKLKPVKHQVWKQKGEEYRLTGLNAWYWRSKTFKSKPRKPPPKGFIKEPVIPVIPKEKKTVLLKPKLPPCHDFLTKRSKKLSIFVLPELELRKLARSGGLKESRSFSYTAKQNNQVWPYGMTPRPVFRTCWLYRNRIVDTIQDVALQLKVFYACIRWDDLQVRAPTTGHKVISTDDATVTIELIKKRDRLPFLNYSEYLIKKVITPIEQPTKYKKLGSKKVVPSARSGLRARRQIEDEEDKGPTTEEVWVAEDQLELWELRQFDEKIERQNQMLRERALREEAEKRRRLEDEKRRKAEQERRLRLGEEAKARLSSTPTTPITPTAPLLISNTVRAPGQPRSLPTTPVLRYLRTDQGQIIRLPVSYLQRGTPLILRHIGPGPNQTNTYIIRPQLTQNANKSTPTQQQQSPVAQQQTCAQSKDLAKAPDGPSEASSVASVVDTGKPTSSTITKEPAATSSITTTGAITTSNAATTSSAETTTSAESSTSTTTTTANTDTSTSTTAENAATTSAPPTKCDGAEALSVGTVKNESAHDGHATGS